MLNPKSIENEKPEPAPTPEPESQTVTEHGGRGGLEPTRYGDWEVGGICSDF